MITLISGLLAAIFALISLAAHFFEKSQQSQAMVQNQAVKDQISANDAKILANQQQAAAIQQETEQKEKDETNESILKDLNGASNTPKS